MVFFLLIIFPFLVPIAYFIGLRLVFSLFEYWYWVMLLVVAIDFVYFLLLYYKNKAKLRFLSAAFVSSAFFIALGFFLIMLLAEGAAIMMFSVLWPLILLIFLYAVLHHSYGTLKTSLVEIRNIVPYFNVVAFFGMAVALVNANVFLAFPWWGVLLLFLVGAFAFNLPFLLLYEDKLRTAVVYDGIITMVMVEIMLALFYLPTGFYVLGAVAALAYYLLAILLQKKFQGMLGGLAVARHSVFIGILILIILATSQWT